MHEHFRALAIHQAKLHKRVLDAWGPTPDPVQAAGLVEALVHDGLWLTKFPLLFTPTFDVKRLARLERTWQTEAPGPGLADEVAALTPLVDADVLRFVLKLTPGDLEGRIEIFWGGRALNKPLWQYLATWFEHDAVLRGRLALSSGLLNTVFD